jgi:2',3'-cyclic-nucleotide 2'-phosphodiesterase / 3'-nucleotidase
VLWERRHLQGKVSAQDILSSAKRVQRRLRRLGADLVIALAHSGLGSSSDPQVCGSHENLSAALAMMPGIDVVIAGHTHEVHPAAPESGTHQKPAPLVMPGCFGSHLGVIDLSMQLSGAGWTVASHRSEVRAVAQRKGPAGKISALAPSDPEITRLAQAATDEMRRAADASIGHTAVALHSYFSLIGHSPVQTLLAEAQLCHMRRLLQDRPEAALPLLTSVAPFKAGGRGGPANFTDISVGEVTARNIADLYIHPNSAVALRLTGAQIALWLERTVSLFHQVLPGSVDAPLVNLAFPAFNFDIIHGLTFQIDLTKPARFDANGAEVDPSARRIQNLRHKGRLIDPKAEFVLATNSYRASGGAGFAGTTPAQLVLEDDRPLRKVLQDHVTKAGHVSPMASPEWGFAPMPGTTVTFDSGQGGFNHAGPVPGLSTAGMQPTGFMRFRLAL